LIEQIKQRRARVGVGQSKRHCSKSSELAAADVMAVARRRVVAYFSERCAILFRQRGSNSGVGIYRVRPLKMAYMNKRGAIR
jgi:hypothetical protein